MKDLKVGCQTFTWEMLGDGFAGGPDDLLRAIAAGGYAGIEITDTMIGRYADKPAEFATALKATGLTLVSFAFGSKSGFTLKEKIGADLEAAQRWQTCHSAGRLRRRWPSPWRPARQEIEPRN